MTLSIGKKGSGVDDVTTLRLLRPLVPQPGEIWADIGAGSGVFTRALARLLGSEGVVYAVDRDREAVRRLGSLRVDGAAARIVALEGDMTGELKLPALDGALLANTLHYVSHAEQPRVLAKVAALLRPAGRLVLAEYDGRAANRWVPYPVPVLRLAELAVTAGLSPPEVTSTRRSSYGGVLYLAGMRLLP